MLLIPMMLLFEGSLLIMKFTEARAARAKGQAEAPQDVQTVP